MTQRRALTGVPVLTLLLAAATCERRPFEWIAGPSVSPVPTARPLVWDSAPELEAWAYNDVTTGPISVETEGTTAFIRIRLSSASSVVLRGPDLVPPVQGMRGLRVRYRWLVPADAGPGGAGRSGDLFAVQPVVAAWSPVSLAGSLVGGTTTWQQADFLVRPAGTVDARYVYLHLDGYGSPVGSGQLEFDSLEVLK